MLGCPKRIFVAAIRVGGARGRFRSEGFMHMTLFTRFTIALGLLFLLAVTIQPAFSQQNKGAGSPVDLVGTWRKVGHEDTHERGSGPDPGEYWGLPLNDAARMRSDTYNEEWVTTSQIMQCRPHPLGYQPLGPDP